MNGIYNGENHRTPYLDVNMLMERKAKKAKRILLMLSTIVMILMVALFVLFAIEIAALGKKAVAIVCIVYFIYATAGIVLMQKVLKKKGENVCQQ